MGQRDAAGEDLMFSTLNELSIMKTYFANLTAVRYGTWMHPVTKEMHMIDHVMVRARSGMFAVMFK